MTIDIASINFINYQYLLYGLALVRMMLLQTRGPLPEPAQATRAPQTPAEDELTAADPTAR